MSSPEGIILEQLYDELEERGIKVGNTVLLAGGWTAVITEIDIDNKDYPIYLDNTSSYTLEGKFNKYSKNTVDIVDWNYKKPENITSNHPDVSYWDNGEVIEVPLPNTFINDGFIKHDEGKSMISLIDPKFIEGLAEVMTQGASKYGRDNWQECTEPHRYLDALLRHTLKYWNGEKVDTESGKSHLYHIAFNAMALDYLDNKLKD